MAVSYFENGGTATGPNQMKGIIQGLRVGDEITVNGDLVVTATAQDSKKGRPVDTPKGSGRIAYRDGSLGNRAVVLIEGRNQPLPIERIDTPELEVETSPIYLHKAVDGAPFCSYEVPYFRVDPYVMSIEMDVVSALNDVDAVQDADAFLEVLPDEVERNEDTDALEVGTVELTRYGVLGIDLDLPPIEQVQGYAAAVTGEN